MIEVPLAEWREQARRLLAEQAQAAAGGTMRGATSGAASALAVGSAGELPLDDIQAAVKTFRSRQWQLTSQSALGFLNLVFPDRRHDEVLFGIFLLTVFKRRLPEQTWPAVDGWLEHVDHWVISDQVAINIAGRLVAEDKSRWKVIHMWMQSPNPWRRRCAVTTSGVVLKKGATTTRELLKLIEPLMKDDVAHVQNVVGWAVRQVARMDENQAVSFLRQWKGRCHPEIYREAGLRLSPQAKMTLLKAKSHQE